MSCSKDLIEKTINLKKDDPEGKMKSMVNIISFDDGVSEDVTKMAED